MACRQQQVRFDTFLFDFLLPPPERALYLPMGGVAGSGVSQGIPAKKQSKFKTAPNTLKNH